MAQWVKNLPVNVGDTGYMGSSPGLERHPGEGNGIPLQYSCLENRCIEEPGGPHCKELDMTQRLSTLVSAWLKWPSGDPAPLLLLK